MADIVYTTVPGKIKPLLTKIKGVGIPPKVTRPWLKSIGFTSSNDPSLIGVLKLVGFIDERSVPTPDWQRFRGPKSAQVLAQGIRAGYSELYGVYPDAHARPNSDLENVFSTSSKAGKQAIQKAVATFKNLAAEADFTNVDVNDQPHIESNGLHLQVSDEKPIKPAAASDGAPSLHIDVQIHISSEASSEQIDQIFASMSKHLYGRN